MAPSVDGVHLNGRVFTRVCSEYKEFADRAVMNPQNTDELLEMKLFIQNVQSNRASELEAMVWCRTLSICPFVSLSVS